MSVRKNIAIIGGGPAGLRAAEVAAAGGAEVTLYDGMPSVGRKFLVAGKSGLNLTNGEDIAEFFSKYSGENLPDEQWQSVLRGFDNKHLREWASGLGVETFVASSGKVFPAPVDGSIKAAPLLRRWILRLREMGVTFKTKHCWVGMVNVANATQKEGAVASTESGLVFMHQNERVTYQHDAVILALGGGSWPRTGSDGHWLSTLSELGIATTPLTAANCGWQTPWPAPVIEEAEGLPLKNIILSAGESARRGELVVTKYGLEGGPIYRLGPAIKALAEPHVKIDFKPDTSHEELVAKMGAVKRNYVREARRRWKLDAATCSLLKYLPDRGPWTSSAQLAREVKCCHIPLVSPRPIEEAISSAGGIRWQELDENFMLKKLSGVFVAGEMIDWEAPTGGYLLQACFATGSHAAAAALHTTHRF